MSANVPTGTGDKSEGKTGNQAAPGQGQGQGHGPVFEMIVLGSGGGPLETDCSG